PRAGHAAADTGHATAGTGHAAAGTAEAGHPGGGGGPRPGRAEPRGPGWLGRGGGWAGRLLLLRALVYVTFHLGSVLRVGALPCVGAALRAAGPQPRPQRLRRAGLPARAATGCPFLAALAVLAGVVVLAAPRPSADYQRLVSDVGSTSDDLQRWLAGPPFHL